VLQTYAKDCDEDLRWLNEPAGRQFLVDETWTYDDEQDEEEDADIVVEKASGQHCTGGLDGEATTTATAAASSVHKIVVTTKTTATTNITDKEDPVSHAAFHFRKHLMKKALHSLVMPVVSCNGSEVVEGGFFASSCCGSGKNGGRKKRNESPAAAALHYLQLVKQCEEDELDEDEDEAETTFWLSVATSAAYFALGDVTNASCYSEVIEHLPPSLEFSKKDLPRAVMGAYVAYRDILQLSAEIEAESDIVGGSSGVGGCADVTARHASVLQTCSKASGLLRDNLLNRTGNKGEFPMAFRLIACEWLLKTRTMLWEQSSSSSRRRRAPLEQLSAFECDVTLLRTIVHDKPSLVPKKFIYEATMRMMAGANPIRTLQLLNRSMRRRRSRRVNSINRNDGDGQQQQQGNKTYAGEHDCAYATMLACKHLPAAILSLPGQRSGMIGQACRTMEKMGDKIAVNICMRMLKKLGYENHEPNISATIIS